MYPEQLIQDVIIWQQFIGVISIIIISEIIIFLGLIILHLIKKLFK